MKWTKIKPYGADSMTYWVSGVYKIVSYDPGQYFDYYIPAKYETWGDAASNRDTHEGHKTLSAAQAACEAHAKTYQPSAKTIRDAERVLAGYLDQEKGAQCHG